MTKTFAAGVLVAAALAAAGCDRGPAAVSGTAGPATGTGPATSAPASAAPTVAPVSSSSPAAARTSAAPEPTGSAIDGNQYGDISAVDTAHRTVTVDLVQYFTGAAAAKACREDGKPTGGGAWCSTYYVRNESTLKRTIPLAARATITVVAYASDGVHPGTPSTLDQVENLLSQSNFYRLRIDGGRITELENVYLP